MPRALKIVVECDRCDSPIEDGENHSGGLTLSIADGPIRQVDVCEECASAVDLNDLIVLYQSAPELPTAPAANSALTCPACTFMGKTPQGLGKHTRSVHDATVKELRKRTAS